MAPPVRQAALTLGILWVALVSLVVAAWAAGSFLVPGPGAFDAAASAHVVMTGATAIDVWTGVSWLGSGLLIFAAGLAICAVLIRRRLFDLAAIVAFGILGSDLLSRVVKALVNRPRPPLAQVAASGSSFPSGHATEAGAFYGVLIALALLYPFRNATHLLVAGLSVAVALAVAYARLALGVHYPTDVIAGLLLGATWAAVTVAAIRAPAGALWRVGWAPSTEAGSRARARKRARPGGVSRRPDQS